MRRFVCAVTGAVALCVAGAVAQQPAPAEPLLGPGAAAARYPRNAQEFDELFQKVKNWGRWGANDQLGAANLITDAKRKEAIANP